MSVLSALWLAACAPGPGPVDLPPPAEGDAVHGAGGPAPQQDALPASDALWLRAPGGRATVTVDLDRWLGWAEEPRLGVRTSPSPSHELELLARAAARRSGDGVARVEVDEGVPGAAALDVAEQLRQAGYPTVGFRPRGVEGAWLPVSEAAQGSPEEPSGAAGSAPPKPFLGLWRDAEALDPDGPLRLAHGPSRAPEGPSPKRLDQAGSGPAWTEPVGVGLVVEQDTTSIDLDAVLTRLHPALAVGPISVAHGPRRDADLLDALELIWAAAELTGRRPGPMHVDVTLRADAPPGSAAAVAKRLRER